MPRPVLSDLVSTARSESPEPAPEAKPLEELSRIGLTERLIKSRILQVTGPIDDKVAARVMSELLVLEADDATAPITMYVNSPGGSVTAGFAIYDVMRFVKPDIRVICTGLAASIATVILLGAPKHLRLALPNTRLLIHQPLIPMTVYGPASDLEITAAEIMKTRARINRLLAEETGKTVERIEADTQRDYWLTAAEAVEYGLLARVVTGRDEV
ncbi:MAG: ATP-dependent Clp protease proteolytic subunit [Myxococcota bacterium]